MKLSDAILLGSTILAGQADGQYFPEAAKGCALGMAAIAKGCTFRRVRLPFPPKDRRTLGAEGVWGDWVVTVAPRPCQCWRWSAPREMRIKDIIAHLFDRHVMGKKDWTLDQLVAWVKTVEPHELLQPTTPFHRVEDSPRGQELGEWQSVRLAFEARHQGRIAGTRRGSRNGSIPVETL